MPTVEQLTALGVSEEDAKRMLAALEPERPVEADKARDADADKAEKPARGETPEPEPEADKTEEPAPEADKAGEAEPQPKPEPEPEPDKTEEADADKAEEPEPEPTPEPEPAPEPEPEPEPTPDAPDYVAENARLREALTASLVAQAAMRRGVKPERLGALKKLADLSGIDPTADDAEALALRAVEIALEEVPELATGAPGIGSLGTHPRESANPIDPFARGFDGR